MCQDTDGSWQIGFENGWCFFIDVASSSEGRHTHSQGERTIKEIYKTGHCKIIYNL